MKRYLRKRNTPEGGLFYDERKIKVSHRDQRIPNPSPLDILSALRINSLLPPITIDLEEEPNSETNPIEID
jgi:hypothetical protein